ncbi:hypothetical protein ACFFRR_010588 [Megaselia abdita]
MFVNTPPPGRQHFARYDSLDEKAKSGLFSKIIDGMPASTMFSKFKGGSANIPQNPWDTNPICQQFEIGKQSASAGPEMVWKIHDAMKKSDGRECSVFLFEKKIAEKLHKPRRKETVTELLRASIKQLERSRHPKMLTVIHPVEECADTLAFATEPVYASLANILAYQEVGTIGPVAGPPSTGASQPSHPPIITRPYHAKEYNFLDIEFKYGLLQLTEALTYLHYTGHMIHRNICPASIFVTKKGTWKLGGLEYIERVNETDVANSITCQPWSSRISKMAQPNLDFTAPETQTQSTCSIMSDMFSMGMVICAIFNRGRPLIQANNSSSSYVKQLDTLETAVHNILPRIPVPLQEATTRLLSKDPTARPTSQLLQLIKYFIDPGVNALKFLDVINMKDPTQKAHFYKITLREALPYIPRKLWWQHIWPSLSNEMKSAEVLAAVLQPVLAIVQDATHQEYETIILPALRGVLSAPKSIQATVTLLENLHIVLEKSVTEEMRLDILPLLFTSFDSNTIQVQGAALVAIANVHEIIDEASLRVTVLPKIKAVYEKNALDSKIVGNVMTCIERILDKLDRQQVLDDILPLLADVRLTEPDLVLRIVNVYRKLLSDRKYGLSIQVMATHIMPSLMPQTVNPALNLEQYLVLHEVLQEMLDQIDRHQRNKLKLDNLSIPSPERHRPLRHQYSQDNMHVPPFNIPNLRIDQRKTSSAEDMARKNSTGSGMLGGWWFGSPSSPDSNFLRVANAFPNRRLSDNTLMTPKIRIAPSCASSPGGTPGGGLPTRRHSSIGPQERRGSAINLSPPTLARSMIGGSMPNTSSSVPFLLTSSMQSIRSRRTSACMSSGPFGSGSGSILQQLGSGMNGNGGVYWIIDC